VGNQQYRYEKEEKEEKQEEKEEKQHGEKRPQDSLSAAVWAFILIWAGLVLLADSLGLLSIFWAFSAWVPGLGGVPQVWSLIMVGAGVILLIEVLVRLTVPTYRRPVGGTIVLAVILIAVGLGNMVGWALGWPVILIAIGLGILISALVRRS
jgi:hypothetical protein